MTKMMDMIKKMNGEPMGFFEHFMIHLISFIIALPIAFALTIVIAMVWDWLVELIEKRK